MATQFTPKSLHGEVITYNQIKNIPSRNAFLEKTIYNETTENISKGITLLFMPNALHEMHLQEKKYDPVNYKIVLFGVFIDGRRSTVVISGIRPYFEVVIPEQHKDQTDDNLSIDNNSEQDIALSLYNKLKQTKFACPTSFEILKGKQFNGYQKNRKTFARFYFDKLKSRTEAIKYVKTQGMDTTADDASCYYRVVCRDYMTTFSSWVNISNYTIRTYSGIRGSVYDVNISNYKTCMDDITTNPKLAKDNIMSMCWDIETYSHDGDLPRPENLEHKMFMIGVTFQWHHSNDQLLRVCLVDHPCDPRPNYLTIVCEDEKKLIKAFGKLVYKMKPDLNLGFNDSDYDWPWLIKRAKVYPGTLTFLAECFDATIHWKNYDDDSIMSYNFKKEQVKLEADAYAEGYSLIFPGYINIDVRTIFRQLYPTAEKSNLNFYLSLNKLDSKKDMPYQELFRIYREMTEVLNRRNVLQTILAGLKLSSVSIANIFNYYDCEYNVLKDKMAEIADYCVVDSQRCHELMKIRSVVMDRREVSNLSYTSIFDSFYRANGMKVRNLVIARGQSQGIKFSNITKAIDNDGKYPGAYVFPPKKGLVTSKTTISERCANALSVIEYAEWATINDDELKDYINVISEYGATLTEQEIVELIDAREKTEKTPLKKCFIDFLKENIGRPITGLDFSSLYPSLIMAYNLSPEYIIKNKNVAMQAQSEGHTLHKIKFMFNNKWVRGWSIRHDNKLDPKDPECKFGIYPMILNELFDARSVLKKKLQKWEHEKEKLNMLSPEEFTKPHIKEEYDTVNFNFNYLDSKQKALKVFMNTFYGETGNKRSPFFVLQLAGAITTAGQDNLKMVQKHVENEGCKVYYGDSVTGDTPLVVRNPLNGIVMIKTIDDLNNENEWTSYDQFKPNDNYCINKQQAECPLQIWTDGNWHNINRVIRHKTNKKIYRVNTHTGCIDVTEDHSLMTPNREKVKPTEVYVGTELLHSFPTEFPEISCSMTNEESFAMGLYMAMESCDSSIKLQYNSKSVPTDILNGHLSIRQSFYDGYCQGSDRSANHSNIIAEFCCKGKTKAQSLYYLVKSLGYKYVSVRLRSDKLDIYSFRITHNFNKNPIAIKKILEISNVDYNTFVYDIETSKGSFLGGVGSLNVSNTDSIYGSMSEKHFYEIDKLYYTGNMQKEAYWTELVNITFQEIAKINKSVNEMLIADNGTKFLKMAFEESLYPVAFLAKKKYYGIPHISQPNFQPKELFIRGLEVKKRGVSEFLRKVCFNIMWDSVNMSNIHTLMELVLKKIDVIYAQNWDFTDFIMTDVFKPNKNNVKVHTFVQRMLNEGIKVKPYERFQYVIVKKNPFKYDNRGRKHDLSIGDKMEYAEHATNKNLTIDLDYYMKGSINGQLARLITYADTFHVDPASDNVDDLKTAEDKTYNNSCKYIENYCSKYYANYGSKGKIYQKIFRMASTIITDKVKEYCGPETVSILNGNYEIENLETWLETKAEKEAIKLTKGYGILHVNNSIKDLQDIEKSNKIKELQDIYFARKSCNLSNMREKAFKERQTLLHRQVSDNLRSLVEILNYHSNMVDNIQTKIKNILDINNSFNEVDDDIPNFDDLPQTGKIDMKNLEKTAIAEMDKLSNNTNMISSLNKLRYIYINMVSNYSFIQKTRLIVDYLIHYRNKSIGLVVKPKDFKINDFIKSNVDDIILEMKNSN